VSFHHRTATLSGIGTGRGRAEDLRRELASWLAAGDDRAVERAPEPHGVSVSLLERGRLWARGYGKDELEALANALFGQRHESRPSGVFRRGSSKK
jgi:hypothetical protein